MGSNFKMLPFLIIILIHVHFRTFGNFWKVVCHSRLSTANTRVCFHLSRIIALCVCPWVFEKLGVLHAPTGFPASQGRRLAVTSHNLIQFITKFCSLQPQISLRGDILSALLLSSFTWVFSFQTPSPLFIPNPTWPVSSNRKVECGSPLLETLPWLSLLLLSSPASSSPASSLICPLSPLLATFPGIVKPGHICALVLSASNTCTSWLAWKTPPLRHVLAPVPALLGNLPIFLYPHHPAFAAASSEYPNP